MISVVLGIAFAVASLAGLWYFTPRHGKVHPFARKPFIETVIPVAVGSGLGAGVAMIISGAVAMF